MRIGTGALCVLLVAGCGGSSTSTKDSPGDRGTPTASTDGGTNNGVTGGY